MIDLLARQRWLRVPIGAKVREFFADFHEFPYQSGASLNRGNINHGLLRRVEALERKKLETPHPAQRRGSSRYAAELEWLVL